jgi:hypothetical protein
MASLRLQAACRRKARAISTSRHFGHASGHGLPTNCTFDNRGLVRRHRGTRTDGCCPWPVYLTSRALPPPHSRGGLRPLLAFLWEYVAKGSAAPDPKFLGCDGCRIIRDALGLPYTPAAGLFGDVDGGRPGKGQSGPAERFQARAPLADGQAPHTPIEILENALDLIAKTAKKFSFS